MTSEQSITMTLPQACKRFGIGLTTGRELARQGRFPGAFKIGNVWRVHRATFDAGVERLAQGGTPEVEPADQVMVRALDDIRLRAVRRA